MKATTASILPLALLTPEAVITGGARSEAVMIFKGVRFVSPVKHAAYGSWISPITAEVVVADSLRLSSPLLHSGQAFWIEQRPDEAGRSVIVRQTNSDQPMDLTPAPFNARSRVHEYGGGEYVVGDGWLYFSHFADQRIYRLSLTGTDSQAVAVTPEGPFRYANAVFDRRRQRLICVMEDHSKSDVPPENRLVTIDVDSGVTETLFSGADFYAAPVISPDGNQLAFFSWEQPHMPWESTSLWVMNLSEQSHELPRCLAGADAGEPGMAICHPRWSPNGMLYFVSDLSGWWNLFRWDGQDEMGSVWADDAEYGVAHWQFGHDTYGFRDNGDIVAIRSSGGTDSLVALALNGQGVATSAKPFDLPFDHFEQVSVQGKTLLVIAGSPDDCSGILEVDLHTSQGAMLKRSTSVTPDPGYISHPTVLTFPTSGGETAHGFYYPPHNTDFAAPEGTNPPLVVFLHGGPTSATDSVLDLRKQFWTSRGFAILDINYRGSTGYGRDYRKQLDGNWGVTDVADCVHGVRHLVNQGLANPKQVAIRGGSAGGFTVLAALAFTQTFSAGASYYGIGDLEALAGDTHKFEARYLDGLIGPYPAEKALYQQRSPINAIDRLNCPVIFFQGLDDKVVPPNQSEAMVAALKAKGIPVAYLPFKGEGHGFREKANLRLALQAEWYFYGKVFGYDVSTIEAPFDF